MVTVENKGSNNQCICTESMTGEEGRLDCYNELKRLRLNHPKNLIIGYLNINSVRSKFENFSQMIKTDLDVVIIAETKLDKTFPKNQFLIKGFGEPFRLDVTSNRGGLLDYVRHGIIAKELPVTNFPNDIQVIPIELSIRKQKWLLLPIYRPPSQDQKYFVDAISVIIDKYSAKLEYVTLIGDFNMEPNDSNLVTLTRDYNLYNRIKKKHVLNRKMAVVLILF